MPNQEYIKVIDFDQVNPEEADNGNLSKFTAFQKKSEEVHPITVASTLRYHALGIISPVNMPPGEAPSRGPQAAWEIEEDLSSGNYLIS